MSFFFIGMFSNPKYSLLIILSSLTATWIAVVASFGSSEAGLLGIILGMLAAAGTAYCFTLFTQYQLSYVHQKRIETAYSVGSRIAHELRTPLLSISNFASAAKKLGKDQQAESDTEELDSFLNKILEEVQFSHRTIDMLLASTRKPPFPLDPNASFSASATVASAIQDYPYANSAERRCVKRIENENFSGKAPQELVKHAIFNLIKNALLSSEDYANAEIVVEYSRKRGRGVIVVKDNGPGVPKKDERNIFDSFFSTRNTGDGTGLGLSFCKSLMTQVGGKIEYRRKNEITMFILTFQLSSSQ